MLKIRNIILISGLFMVTACANFRETAGLQRPAPDEFKVVSNPPLSIPPQFTLRPPVAGAKRPQQVDTEQEAKNILFETSEKADIGDESKGESIFLKRADAEDADPEIKSVLTQDEINAEKAAKKKSFMQKMASAVGFKSDADKEAVIDANKEKERIAAANQVAASQNQKETKPAGEADIPNVEPAAGGLLNNVFGF